MVGTRWPSNARLDSLLSSDRRDKSCSKYLPLPTLPLSPTCMRAGGNLAISFLSTTYESTTQARPAPLPPKDFSLPLSLCTRPCPFQRPDPTVWNRSLCPCASESRAVGCMTRMTQRELWEWDAKQHAHARRSIYELWRGNPWEMEEVVKPAPHSHMPRDCLHAAAALRNT